MLRDTVPAIASAILSSNPAQGRAEDSTSGRTFFVSPPLWRKLTSANSDRISFLRGVTRSWSRKELRNCTLWELTVPFGGSILVRRDKADTARLGRDWGGVKTMINHPNRRKMDLDRALHRARRLTGDGSAERALLDAIKTVQPSTMTLAEAHAALVAKYVSKWGENAWEAIVRHDYPTLGLALNKLANWDSDNKDLSLAAQAIIAMTNDDVAALRKSA